MNKVAPGEKPHNESHKIRDLVVVNVLDSRDMSKTGGSSGFGFFNSGSGNIGFTKITGATTGEWRQQRPNS